MATSRSIARIRFGTSAELAADDILEEGEFAYATDTKVLKLGDGSTVIGTLATLVDLA